MKDVYFGGTVLPPKPSDPTDASDPTFRFTMAEKQKLNLRGVPIVMEHSTRERDKIGVALNNYTLPSGETIMIGKLNGKGLKSIFARHAIQGNDPWYGSLSLCHAHRRYSDGTCEKIAKEVSLCKYPRREGSDIFILDDQTNKKDYLKSSIGASKMTISPEASKVSTSATETANIVAVPAKQQVSSVKQSAETEHLASTSGCDLTSNTPTSAVISKLQRVIIMQEQQLAEVLASSKVAEQNADTLKAELSVIHQAATDKANAEKEEAKKKAELIALSLVESLQNELPDNIDDATKESFRIIADLAPGHARAVYELCHEASIRHKKGVEALEKSIEESKAAVIQTQFDNVMSKRKAITPVAVANMSTKSEVVNESVHQAASSDAWFRKAMASHIGKGRNARQLMESVQEMNREKFIPKFDNKRRRFY